MASAHGGYVRAISFQLTHFTKLMSTMHYGWDRDERITFWGQKVKGQGHDEIEYAGNTALCLHFFETVGLEGQPSSL